MNRFSIEFCGRALTRFNFVDIRDRLKNYVHLLTSHTEPAEEVSHTKMKKSGKYQTEKNRLYILNN